MIIICVVLKRPELGPVLFMPTTGSKTRWHLLSFGDFLGIYANEFVALAHLALELLAL